jgi:hypothetical protein
MEVEHGVVLGVVLRAQSSAVRAPHELTGHGRAGLGMHSENAEHSVSSSYYPFCPAPLPPLEKRRDLVSRTNLA